MTETEITKDASLLRCAIKKSWSVSKKIGLWLGGIAVALVACYVIYLGATSQTAATVWANFTGWCSSAAGIITGFIALIPWELWAVIIGIGAIFGYSLVWCMARNLTDKDWQSETAKNIAFAAAAFAAFAAFAAAAAVAFAFADSKALLFIGAYLHYRARIKSSKTNETNSGEVK